MANLRCTSCGRYVNDAADHAPDCPLYKKPDVYEDEKLVEEPVPNPAMGTRRYQSCQSPYGCLVPGEGCVGPCPISTAEAAAMNAAFEKDNP